MPQTVRAKFRCNEMTKRKAGWPGGVPFHYEFSFGAVTSGSEENESFFAATPSGEVKLRTVKDDLFEVGKEYYLDFTPAE